MSLNFSKPRFYKAVQRFLGTLLLVSLFSVVHAQKTGTVKFQVDNENGYFEIMVDDTSLVKQYKVTMTTGSHKAQVWSYGYDIKDIEFTVLPDSVTEVYVKLDRSDAYMAYEQSYKNYRMKFHKSITVPVSATLAMGITSGIFLLKGYDLKKEITTGIENYNLTPVPSEIADIKAGVETNNRKYTVCRNGYYITGGLTVLGIAGSIYSGIRFRNNNTEPVYSRTSPFATKSSFYMTPYGFRFIYTFG